MTQIWDKTDIGRESLITFTTLIGIIIQISPIGTTFNYQPTPQKLNFEITTENFIKTTNEQPEHDQMKH
jgi:hypothetical protein